MQAVQEEFQINDVYDKLEKIPFGPDFRTYSFNSGKHVYLLLKFIKNSRYEQFPFEFVYVRRMPNNDDIQIFKIYAEECEIRVKL